MHPLAGLVMPVLMSDAKPETGQCSKREAKRRMDDALKRALSKPHQTHKANGHPDGSTTGPGGRVLRQPLIPRAVSGYWRRHSTLGYKSPVQFEMAGRE